MTQKVHEMTIKVTEDNDTYSAALRLERAGFWAVVAWTALTCGLLGALPDDLRQSPLGQALEKSMELVREAQGNPDQYTHSQQVDE